MLTRRMTNGKSALTLKQSNDVIRHDFPLVVTAQSIPHPLSAYNFFWFHSSSLCMHFSLIFIHWFFFLISYPTLIMILNFFSKKKFNNWNRNGKERRWISRETRASALTCENIQTVNYNKESVGGSSEYFLSLHNNNFTFR